MGKYSVFSRVLLPLLLLALSTAKPAHADNWVSLSGADTLRELVTGTNAEIELKPGVTASGEYYADGTARIEAWGETFLRTWEVSGDDQVCYSSVTDTDCYTFEQNLDAPGEYRTRHAETGDLTVFHISEADPNIATRDTAPDSDGGLGSPSAEEIAAELSNPNSTLGTMSVQFGYLALDGNLPGASSQDGLRATFQPSLPYPLSATTNLFVRPAIPIIISQDVPNMGGGFDSKGVDLGDITFDASLARGFPNGVVMIGGLTGTLPTATDDALGLINGCWAPNLRSRRSRNGVCLAYSSLINGILPVKMLSAPALPLASIFTRSTFVMAGRSPARQHFPTTIRPTATITSRFHWLSVSRKRPSYAGDRGSSVCNIGTIWSRLTYSGRTGRFA